jgi:hypothetical protein
MKRLKAFISDHPLLTALIIGVFASLISAFLFLPINVLFGSFFRFLINIEVPDIVLLGISSLALILCLKKRRENIDSGKINVPFKRKLIFAKNAYWSIRYCGQPHDGPYCPSCYIDKDKESHMISTTRIGFFMCPICKLEVMTSIPSDSELLTKPIC